MKVHTTNYFNTFIEVAADTNAISGTKPQTKGDKMTIAGIQYELIMENPYQYTSDDVLFQVFADRNHLAKTEYKEAREKFFSRGQACFRASPLTKTYGFGIHFNNYGKVSICGMETPEYKKFVANENIKKVRAMRSRKI